MDGGSAKNRSLTLVKKNSQAYCKQLAGSTLRAWLNFTPRRAVHGGTSTPLDPLTFSTTQLLRVTFRHGKLSSSTTPSTILEFVVWYKFKDNNPLIILTYLINKLYHLLLNSSKHLQGIKLSKLNDLQDYASFHSYQLPHATFSVPTQTPINLFEHKKLSNKFNNETREYNLTQKN